VPQLKILRRGVDVAVACPGRLADLVRRGNVKLDEVEIVVIDEADRMADMGFLPDVRRLLDMVREDRQTLLFSATLDGDVDVLIRNYQRDPVRCEVVDDADAADRTTHLFVHTKREERVSMSADLISTHGSAIVFCRTKHGTDRVAAQLQRAGVTAAPIHGGRSQAQRDKALALFQAGKVSALVATDVAARGIHVDAVGCVVHFDLPGDVKDYVHRSGRTGRAGADGMVVSLVTDTDVAKARALQKDLSLAGPPLPSAASSPSPTGRSGPPPRRQGRPQARPQRPAVAKARNGRNRRGAGGRRRAA